MPLSSLTDAIITFYFEFTLFDTKKQYISQTRTFARFLWGR